MVRCVIGLLMCILVRCSCVLFGGGGVIAGFIVSGNAILIGESV